MKARYFAAAALSLGSFLCGATTSQAVSDSDVGDICRAAISVLMFQEMSIIRLSKIENEIAYVEYKRPSDGKVWKNRCKIEGRSVVWGTVDADGPGSGFGRWRNDPADEQIIFFTFPNSVAIIVTYADGSSETTRVGM